MIIKKSKTGFTHLIWINGMTGGLMILLELLELNNNKLINL